MKWLGAIFSCAVLASVSAGSLSTRSPKDLKDIVKDVVQIGQNNVKLIEIVQTDLASLEKELAYVTITATSTIARQFAYHKQIIQQTALSFSKTERDNLETTSGKDTQRCVIAANTTLNFLAKNHNDVLNGIKDNTWVQLKDSQQSYIALTQKPVNIDKFNNKIELECVEDYFTTYNTLKQCLNEALQSVKDQIDEFYKNFEIARSLLEDITVSQLQDYTDVDQGFNADLAQAVLDYDACLKKL